MARQEGCPAEITLELIAGRWKPMAIYWLLKGARRFNQLQRDLGGITHRTLARQLREMEADGLVVRRDYKEIPPRVEYALTPLGRSLEPVLQAMHDWALAHPEARRRERAEGASRSGA
ncbi:winged helix-turn-helix transcriptional regulator [Amphiplicatus metriothermophilus]|uniref:Transcriptional regulator, HxlR family n=1 Tax=Amphiplicatus metriothermophilus TaxID=1519374 RepID=A0A239PL09_9PROT|nr:helix-turn-helix domain-containing protein [Amphiplicatus metriothermophilus]MBB5517347.1 DNA-binding HxlR family transcriptional regulator [Amphiplicatus metriothermophilus]SNT68317.1 transcriptional regulator, HxlR family [Amphiplicatus metriothermophilus]